MSVEDDLPHVVETMVRSMSSGRGRATVAPVSEATAMTGPPSSSAKVAPATVMAGPPSKTSSEYLHFAHTENDPHGTTSPYCRPVLCLCLVAAIAAYVMVFHVHTDAPTSAPTRLPTTLLPVSVPPTTSAPRSSTPTAAPVTAPTLSLAPSATPSSTPTRPSAAPTAAPTVDGQTLAPTTAPTSSAPTATPSGSPTSSVPTTSPSSAPASSAPTATPSSSPTSSMPTTSPSNAPASSAPTAAPTSSMPTAAPSRSPATAAPSTAPTASPRSSLPTSSPSASPTVIGNATFNFSVTTSTLSYSDSTNDISARLRDTGSNVSTTWVGLGSTWSKGATVDVSVVLPNTIAFTAATTELDLSSTTGSNGWRPTHVVVARTTAPGSGQIQSLSLTFDNPSSLYIGASVKDRTFTATTSSPTPVPTKQPTACSAGNASSSFGTPPGVRSNWVTPAPGLTASTYANSKFSLWLNCSRRAAQRFAYNLTQDCGNLARQTWFTYDPTIPTSCEQTSTATYGSSNWTPSWDLGHLVPANHMDDSADAIAQSNYITNILPQVSVMNRGAWLATEEITDCFRDLVPLSIVGGAVFNASDEPRFSMFKTSHGVDTPSFFWKVIVRGDAAGWSGTGGSPAVAWWVPNDEAAVRGNLDSYLVSLTQLQDLLAVFSQPELFDEYYDAGEMSWRPSVSPAKPEGCDISRR